MCPGGWQREMRQSRYLGVARLRCINQRTRSGKCGPRRVQCTLRSRTKYPDVCFWHFPKVAPLALGSRSWFQTGLWQTLYRHVYEFMPYSVGSES
jgi:hypothetical protein